jgi:hypothetical protein
MPMASPKQGLRTQVVETRLQSMTAEDFVVISREHEIHQQTAAPRFILDALRQLDDVYVG